MKLSAIQLSVYVLVSIVLFSCKKNKASDIAKPDISVADHTSDLALIYHGGSQRPVWNADQLKYYVFRKTNNQVEWLFDGFLFLEIQAKINNKEYDFGSAKSYTLKPTKAEWEWLLAKTISTSFGPGAIEYLLDSLYKAGNPVPFKRKVTLGLPSPIIGTDWGTINRIPLNFNKEEDRVTAVKWYIDQAISQFKEKNYKHVELEGFYWIPESISEDLAVIQQVTEYVHQKNLKICWIPYNYSPGADKWKIAGFDIAYQQPNYFFTLDKTLSIMSRALTFSRDNGMAMEVEFDNKIFTPGFLPRFYTYLEMFEKYNVWQSPSVAYYEGGGAWMNMAKSSDSEVFKAYKDLGDIVVARQKRLAETLKK